MNMITIDRSVVQQALAFTMRDFASLRDFEAAKAVLHDNLRAALAQQDESETCTWHQDGDSDSGVYATSCRRFFNLTDGTPEDNKMQWCCYCGKRLVQELITEDGDE